MNSPLFAKMRAPNTPPKAPRAYNINATDTLLVNME